MLNVWLSCCKSDRWHWSFSSYSEAVSILLREKHGEISAAQLDNLGVTPVAPCGGATSCWTGGAWLDVAVWHSSLSRTHTYTCTEPGAHTRPGNKWWNMNMSAWRDPLLILIKGGNNSIPGGRGTSSPSIWTSGVVNYGYWSDVAAAVLPYHWGASLIISSAAKIKLSDFFSFFFWRRRQRQKTTKCNTDKIIHMF